MNWNAAQAEEICGDLLQSLITAHPSIKWERADAKGDDGVIYFTNDSSERVLVVISREALEDYRDANDQSKSYKEQQLAHYMSKINDERLTEALIQSKHLAP